MRGRIYSVIVNILFLIILSALFYLQVLRWPLYHDLAKKNHIRLIPLPGLRGTIYDRNGLTIADNRLSFDVVIIPQEVENVDTTYNRLSQVLGISVLPRTLRWYVYGERTSHLIGYLSLINKEELEKLGDYGYSMSDLVGRSGIERMYDKYLKGEDGGTQLEVDATGRLVKILGSKNQKKGTDISLTVDAKLQAYASDCLEGVKGSVVIMDPRNGEMLAMASSPSFDSNIFVERGRGDEAVDYMKSGSFPMLNRAINGRYPPGSIFKIIVTYAALETKAITEHTTFVCGGKYFLGKAEFDCWKEGGHGPQDLRDAITHSCNIYFYNLGRKLGPDIISAHAQKLGLGKPTGIDIEGESRGLVPSPAWKKTRRNQNWYEGETLNVAIGQGDLLVTPLQMVEVVSVFATGGNAPRPHIIKKIGNAALVRSLR